MAEYDTSSGRHLAFRHFLWVLPAALAGLALAQSVGPREDSPPPTPKHEVKEILHGVSIVDPYRWLEEQNSPETRAWIEKENKYTHSILDSLPERDIIKGRLTELENVDTLFRSESLSLPLERNGSYFFCKRPADKDLFIIYMRRGLHGKDELLIDPRLLSPDHSTSVTLEDVSQNGAVLAYGVRHGGEDEETIYFLGVSGRQNLPDTLPRAVYFSVSLEPEAGGVYYSREAPQGPRVYRHKMGTDPAGDTEIFGRGYGPEKAAMTTLSEDGRYLTIHILHGAVGDKTEVYVQDLREHGPIVAVVNDIDARFWGVVAGDRLLLQTNWRAPKGRVVAAELARPGHEQWREVIPETDAPIEDFAAVGGKLFLTYLRSASSDLRVFDAHGKPEREVELPTTGSVLGVAGRWSNREVFYGFTSFHIPWTVFRYDTTQATQEVWARPNVPFKSEKFEVKQVWYQSKDNTRLPMFLVHDKGIRLDRSNPTLLTGYGGFNVSRTPLFSAAAALWVERGGVFAQANLRGGGEFGEAWHRAGMLDKKQNVFDDFFAAAEWLVEHRYTSPSRLAITGRSNGGLLVGAAFTQRPDLFQAAVCRYPLLDMLRYHKFLVAQFWVPEYGSADDPAQFKYLYAYSPYHNVKPGTKYPAVLFVSGDSDTRVAPLHARKMAALMQAATGSNRPVLLLYDTSSGHSGGRPLGKEIDAQTDELSFLLWQLGALEEKERPQRDDAR